MGYLLCKDAASVWLFVLKNTAFKTQRFIVMIGSRTAATAVGVLPAPYVEKRRLRGALSLFVCRASGLFKTYDWSPQLVTVSTFEWRYCHQCQPLMSTFCTGFQTGSVSPLQSWGRRRNVT
ncbi:MAG: hypothetical protein ACLR23_07570 [Clostridia bacterium]